MGVKAHPGSAERCLSHLRIPQEPLHHRCDTRWRCIVCGHRVLRRGADARDGSGCVLWDVGADQLLRPDGRRRHGRKAAQGAGAWAGDDGLCFGRDHCRGHLCHGHRGVGVGKAWPARARPGLHPPQRAHAGPSRHELAGGQATADHRDSGRACQLQHAEGGVGSGVGLGRGLLRSLGCEHCARRVVHQALACRRPGGGHRRGLRRLPEPHAGPHERVLLPPEHVGDFSRRWELLLLHG
mmetsp:Transcript_44137/g.127675  ORF Transcript_44137/g.127675 Transcript_44137/m.127675 type:complete len:239 (+) Transcript_44137:317-1033(+)